MKIIDGKAISAKTKEELRLEVAELKQKGISVGLAVIIVGDDPASRVYVNNKKKACELLGIYSEEYALPADTNMESLLGLIEELNTRKDINGILCQLPLPRHLDEKAVINAISPEKDVDAFHPVNVGKIMIGDFDFLPCTPAGVMRLIDETGVSIEGKNCVVIGRSNIVGKPMAMLLLHRNATVTICHTKTVDMPSVVKEADIVIVAAGRAGVIDGSYLREGQVVIDVGINVNEEGKLCGDVKYDEAERIVDAITPVPGGAGSVTTSVLVGHVVEAAMRKYL